MRSIGKRGGWERKQIASSHIRRAVGVPALQRPTTVFPVGQTDAAATSGLVPTERADRLGSQRPAPQPFSLSLSLSLSFPLLLGVFLFAPAARTHEGGLCFRPDRTLARETSRKEAFDGLGWKLWMIRYQLPLFHRRPPWSNARSLNDDARTSISPVRVCWSETDRLFGCGGEDA